jgi:glycosyltransferase involved in cell wall biosynthesis
MRLAYFSPLSPQRSGIADYNDELLPYLASRARVDLFVDGFEPANAGTRALFKFFDYRAEPERLKQLTDYDAVVYHIGNDHGYHAGIYEVARDFPGVVVLHDFALQAFFLSLAHERVDLDIYLDELEACHGAEARVEAELALSRGSAPTFYSQPEAFPLNCRLARDAEGIIVHSEWSRARLARIAPATPITVVQHHVLPDAPRKEWDASSAASDASAPGGEGDEVWGRPVEIASFGHITLEKGIGRVLGALASLKEEHDFRFTLVGQSDGIDVRELIRAQDLSDRVAVTGYVPLAEFEVRLAACDIVVNLRERTVGETSGSVCRAMAAGIPVVVSNTGWFAELPDDCVIKIDANDVGDAQLREALVRLIADEPLRRRIGERAHAYALAEHSIERSADGYIEFISRVIARRVRRRFINDVAEELAACGVVENDESLLRGVAAEIARVAPAHLFEANEHESES